HYENVLVTRVHPEYILNGNIPGIDTVDDIPEDFWQRRYQSINNFEKHITDNGTIVLKLYVHPRKDEPTNRSPRSFAKEKPNWKFWPGDLNERRIWQEYMHCYAVAIQQTTKKHAPSYIITADNKKVSPYLVAKLILDEM